MNLLKNTRVYLAGPVEHDPSAGSWRERITKQLTKYDVFIFDPLVKPSWLDPLCKNNPQLYIPSLKGESNAMSKDDVYVANVELRRLCLRSVTAADWIICYLPKKWTTGTFEEIYLAGRQDKPVLFCTPDGIPSSWMPPIFSTSETTNDTFFPNWDALLEYVDKLNEGTVEVDPIKWLPIFYKRDLANGGLKPLPGRELIGG
jgi:nucleoside 2-deoxyribosyltransferase